ncbi:MAG: LytR C-terminal domain-containing protein [Ilumatobacter sp.]|uniref:LytR C-terminal domain-containing protein n=1 Tax=Ilumatobacter sp. TaxID=1967498 RepID=UPI003918CAD8
MFPRVAPVALVGVLALAACGGGDDAPATTTTDVPVATAAPTPPATDPPETTPTTTTLPPLVTEGATVVVANSSIVGGAAGRMTDELGLTGFTTATPTNGIDKVDDSIVYYSDAEGAQAVAESVGRALGGVTVEALPETVPTESGDIAGAQVLVLLGNNQADRTIDQLSGTATPDVETNGLTIVVANASGVSGSAGRMSTTLDNAGFTVGEATNAVVQLADSVVHYTDAEGAQADAEALAAALGGVEVEPMPDEIPTESSEIDGDVLLLLGTNQADQSLGTLNP